jgi:hypothetical protein
MRRALNIIALAGVALTAAAPASAAVPATVTLAECSVEDHEAAFQARMQLVDGASRMAMRFTLIEETAADRAAPIKAPGLGRWHSSKPGVRSFRYRQGFRNLSENATYRVRVGFRWYSAAGEELERASRRSAPCRQFVELPNLVAQFRKFSPTTSPGVWRYEAVVKNTGKGTATNVPVRFTVDGSVIDTLTLASLAPGESRSLAIRGPQCRRLAKLEVDPDKVITETTDEDNLSEWQCAGLTITG